MPILKPAFYDISKTTKTSHYIETGAYLGNGIQFVLNTYPHIHSIELSEEWYHYNVHQFKDHSNVKMYLGDSKRILPELLQTINEPITLFLDAHYSGGKTAFGEEETPLLFELDILKKRDFDDIIIIDDCRLLGSTGICGIAPNDPVYPTMTYDWSQITENKITNLLKDGYIILKNTHGEYSDGPLDQYIITKPKNY